MVSEAAPPGELNLSLVTRYFRTISARCAGRLNASFAPTTSLYAFQKDRSKMRIRSSSLDRKEHRLRSITSDFPHQRRRTEEPVRSSVTTGNCFTQYEHDEFWIVSDDSPLQKQVQTRLKKPYLEEAKKRDIQ